MAFTLKQVHSIEAKDFNLDDGVRQVGMWFWDVGNVEGGGGAGAIFYVCL